MRAQLTAENHGSLILIRPITAPARSWLHEHVDGEAQWFSGALVVEPRFFDALCVGLNDAGFVVRGAA